MPISLAESVASVATSPVTAAVVSNVGTTAATGDATVLGLSAILNGVAHVLKQPRFFKQNIWLFPTLLVVGVGLALFLTEDAKQAVLKGGLAAWQSVVNYGGLGPKGLRLLGAGTD